VGAVLSLVLGGAVASFWLPTTTFVTSPDATQVVRFVVRYSTGPVEGRIQPVEGTLEFHAAARDSGLTGRFVVDMTSIDTGVTLRDRQLRTDYLETNRYDEAVFAFDRAVPHDWVQEKDGVVRFTLDGEMTLHGVTQAETVEATLTPADDEYSAVVRFNILLTDYDIEPPIWLFLRVQDEVQVSVLLRLEPDAEVAGG
jgi:polyisoprenoid-binding protein YceI